MLIKSGVGERGLKSKDEHDFFETITPAKNRILA
jgi:hypothetical protein